MEIWSIIIDDEPHAVAELSDIIARVPGISVHGEFESAGAALDFLKKIGHVDVIFCDINMPELNGLAAAELLRAYCDHLIFVTAHREHALDAFGVRASGYLLKPLTDTAVIGTVTEIAKLRAKKRPNNDGEVIFIKGSHKNSFTKLELKKVLAVEAMLNYVNIHSESGDDTTYLTLKTMAEMLRKYENFYRISKSVIINIDHVKSVDGNVLRMNNGASYTIGETYKNAFRAYLKERTLNP